MTDAISLSTADDRDDVVSVDALVGEADDAVAAASEDRTVAELRARMERAEARLLRVGVRETVARAAALTAQVRATRQLLSRNQSLVEPTGRPSVDRDAAARPARLAPLARHAVPAARWAGVRLAEAAAVSDPAFGDVERRITDAMGAGPTSGDWPDLTLDGCPETVRSAAAGIGARSILVVPVADGHVVLAAGEPHAFDAANRVLATRFAEHVERGDPDARRVRDVVGEATRVVARRDHLDVDGAFEVLLETASRSDRTVVEVAEEIGEGLDDPARPAADTAPSATPRTTPRTTPSEPAVLRRALACIEEHADEDLGVTDIAQAARIGVRGLQQVFRQYRDTTPLEYLRQVRLERAHQELEAADAMGGDTVAAVASRWRFGHAGRFSVAYRRRFGQSPSTTLRA